MSSGQDHCCAAKRGRSATSAEAARTDQSAKDANATHVNGPDPDLLTQLADSADTQLHMVGLDGGTFLMGSADRLAYPEDGESPVRRVRVEPFAIAATTVTVAQFAAFVDDTGYRTDAERLGDSLVFAGLLEASLFNTTPAVAATPWWHQVPGACWYRPEGPGSTAAERADHPVTHVSQRDALAYCTWLSVRLPTEAEWEFASRGGLEGQPFPWGAQREPDGALRMNAFPGSFPDAPTAAVGTVPVTSFAPNGYGLYNTTGNVWEWTCGTWSDGFTHGDGERDTNYDTDDRPVLRGGSYMCHESYCRRYRTSARTPASADSGLGHTGFRIAIEV